METLIAWIGLFFVLSAVMPMHQALTHRKSIGVALWDGCNGLGYFFSACILLTILKFLAQICVQVLTGPIWDWEKIAPWNNLILGAYFWGGPFVALYWSLQALDQARRMTRPSHDVKSPVRELCQEASRLCISSVAESPTAKATDIGTLRISRLNRGPSPVTIQPACRAIPESGGGF